MAADDDGEVFEITDFTTASDWERFISRVEEILHEWKLVSCNPKPAAPKDAYTTGIWEERTEELAFADFKFNLTHICLKQPDDDSEKSKERESVDEEGEEENDEEVTPTVYMDLMNMENDFPSRAHCICRWYGLQDFVILYPANSSEAIMSESKTKLLLSSASIALSDAGCMVPIFVQVQQKWRRMYHGTCILTGSSIEFGMVHLKKMPAQFSHLAGLLDMFKAKLGSVSEPRPPVSVAVRFLYMLYDWVNSPWSQALPDFDGEVGCSGIEQLPFGACEDPVCALQLYCTWPSLSEDMIVENQVYSDLDPLQAPQWSVRIQMTEDPQCLLGEYLVNFLALCHRRETLDQLIGNFCTSSGENEADISNALQRLTEPAVPYNIPSLTSYVSHSQKPRDKTKDAPIQGELLDQIVQFLFPDAKSATSEDKTETSETRESTTPHPLQLELAKQLKSAPVGGLLHRLSVCLCVLNHNHGGMLAVAQMWQEFVLEMRYRWENSYMIEGVESGPPNLGSSILQQKLQMLNCCIEHKKKREQLHKGYTGEPDSPPSSPYRGPSTSRVSRSLSQEEVINEMEAELVAGGNSQSETAADQTDQPGPSTSTDGEASALKEVDKPADEKNVTSDNSSDDEFFECGGDDGDNKSDEKDEDAQAENQSGNSASGTQSRRESKTENKTEVQSEKDEDTQAENQSGDSASGTQSRRESKTEVQSEKDVDTRAESQSRDSASETQSRRESRTEIQSESDCDPGDNSMTNSQTRESVSSMSVHSDSAFKESYSHKPEGRLAHFQDLRLINCDEKMYIPITQEPAPMTEDMLEEHAEVLAKLGTSAEGAELRARMQSACLLSDMESFKAANPGCVLEDFVRWYSPRDWVEEQVEDENGQVISQGHLSVRMQIPGNMWVEVWQTARPVPARRQKRLFDDTKEAEKVLHFLSALMPSDVVLHLLPMLIHAALLKAIENDDPKIPLLKQVLEHACLKASQVTRAPKQDVKKYEEVTRMIMHAELILARNISLKAKFTEELLEHADAKEELEKFVSAVLQTAEVEVRGGPMGPAGSVIYKLFQAAQRASYMLLDDDDSDHKDEDDGKSNTSVPNFPRPSGREYILRTIVPRPAPYSKTLPQRMFCSIEEDEFRLAGAFASDTVFQ